jgi:D-arabinan exo alpha-(1,3)/(1,5)-arabinofuranosidase (non-reducing end)
MRPGAFGGRWLSVAGVVLAIVSRASAQTYTYPELAGRLTNLEALATLPVAGARCALWSSYDRASYYDSNTGQYVNWDANNDCCGVIRMEGTNAVLAEMRGPGCIWRMWSATPAAGHARIYLDGTNGPPTLDLPFSAYFDGQHAPFTNSALVHTTPANGWNNYTPIPYQVSCKIIAEPGWGQYYHFTYGTFPSGTVVPTFNPALSAPDAAALAQVNAFLSHCGFDPAGVRPSQVTLTNTVHAVGASTQLVAQLSGPAAITALRMKLDLPASPADYDLLRQLALQIKWDGESTPSVWAPLGDFFGTAPGGNVYTSLPLGHTADGWWYCYWYMPFATSARVELINDDTNQHQVIFQVTSAPLSRSIGQYGRFHAKWHRDAFLPTAPGRDIDWTLLKCTGAGRFVGTMLHVYNPGGGWWGEGDDKFFVDAEPFPSSFGTGSEDYFGYAWSSPVLFQHALHNQTHNDGENKGHISVNRWHITDAVPFQQSFEGCIEKYFSNQRPTLYAAMVYWYLAVGGQDDYPPVPVDQRLGYWTTPVVFKVPGALEGEDLQVLSVTAGTPQRQDMSGFTGQWSDGAQLWWTGGHAGDSLALALPVTNSGTYQVSLQMTKARDYGIVQLDLDGLPLGGAFDLYNPTVEPTGPIVLGDHFLSAAQHVLTAQIIGANTNAVLSYMFGLDYVKLEAPLTASDALNLGNPAGDLAVIFSAPVEPASATNLSNYALDNGAGVTAARLGATPDTVLLRATGLNPGTAYTATINNVRDTASPPNTIPLNTTVAVEQGLNTWLRLDEATGTTASDASGNGRDGTLMSDALPGYEGKVFRSVKFAGSAGGYIQLPSGYANLTTNGMTVALWANPTAEGAGANWDRFIDLGNGAASDNILLARNGTSSRLTFEVYNGGSSGGKVNSPDGTLVLSQWQHLAATLDPWGNVALYKNGVLLTNGTTGVPGLVTRTRNFLGLSNWSGDDHYAGRMDDVRIYNRVLSPAAILALANGGGPDDAAPSNGVVSVAATVPTTALTNTPPGVFTLSRTGNTNGPLTIYYALGGTAPNGSSYEFLPGSAVIPAGAGSVPVWVRPIAHSFAEMSQSVLLTVTGGTGYSIGESDTATVTIENNGLVPVLTLELENTNLSLSWPGWASGFGLEFTTQLRPAAVWAPVTNTPQLLNGRFWLNLPPPPMPTFYRLRQ